MFTQKPKQRELLNTSNEGLYAFDQLDAPLYIVDQTDGLLWHWMSASYVDLGHLEDNLSFVDWINAVALEWERCFRCYATWWCIVVQIVMTNTAHCEFSLKSSSHW